MSFCFCEQRCDVGQLLLFEITVLIISFQSQSVVTVCTEFSGARQSLRLLGMWAYMFDIFVIIQCTCRVFAFRGLRRKKSRPTFCTIRPVLMMLDCETCWVVLNSCLQRPEFLQHRTLLFFVFDLGHGSWCATVCGVGSVVVFADSSFGC